MWPIKALTDCRRVETMLHASFYHVIGAWTLNGEVNREMRVKVKIDRKSRHANAVHSRNHERSSWQMTSVHNVAFTPPRLLHLCIQDPPNTPNSNHETGTTLPLPFSDSLPHPRRLGAIPPLLLPLESLPRPRRPDSSPSPLPQPFKQQSHAPRGRPNRIHGCYHLRCNRQNANHSHFQRSNPRHRLHF